MRYLYTFVFYLLLPLIVLRLVWRGFRAPAYWRRWPERFGFFPKCSGRVWIHAVSMGEVQASLPLAQILLKAHHSLLITTMTPTGSQRVRDLFGNVVEHVYLPYDLPDAVARFLKQTRPDLLILMETELWPNLLSACHKKNIPVILVNARLSLQSAQRYQWIKGLVRPMLKSISIIAAQTEKDAERFISLGADQIRVTGNIKFDAVPSLYRSQQIKTLRQQWGAHRLVWIAASTHAGEEEEVLAALAQIKKTFNELLLVLVPRHPDRFNQVAKLCRQHEYHVVRRSEGHLCSPETDIYLVDTIGELASLYTIADIVFVGGTLVPIGGHNLMEPAAVGVPIIFGSYVFEWEEVSQRLLEAQAACQIHHPSQLAEVIERYLKDENLRHITGERARLFVQQNRGALEQVITIIEPYLSKNV